MKGSPRVGHKDDEDVSNSEIAAANVYRIETDRIKRIMTELIYQLKTLAHLPGLLDSEDNILKEYLAPVEAEFIMQVCRSYTNLYKNNYIPDDNVDVTQITNMLEKIPIANDQDMKPQDPFMSHVVDLIMGSNKLVDYLQSCELTANKHTKMFISCMESLQTIVEDDLNMSAKAEIKREQELKAAFRTNNLLIANNSELEELLEKQRSELEEELDKKNQVIAALNEKILLVKERFHNEIEDLVHKSEKQMMQEIVASEARQAELAEEAKLAVARYKMLLEDHLSEEKGLRAKKLKVETQLASWVAKYDQDIGDKQAELEALQAEYDKEKQEVDILKEKFDEQEDEYEILMKERDDEERRIYEEKAYIYLSNRSARIIQRCWRAYKERKAARKKARKSRKRGGSGGKKSGKGGKKKGSPKDQDKLTRDGPDPSAFLNDKFSKELLADIKDKDAFAKTDVEVDLAAD